MNRYLSSILATNQWKKELSSELSKSLRIWTFLQTHLEKQKQSNYVFSMTRPENTVHVQKTVLFGDV